ncbi:MAG: pyridoxal phosphate-dependent aminotransferase [Anaerovoracaceae bacterium]
MNQFIMAEQNARTITGDDKIFALNGKAKEMIAKVGKDKVANATLGALMDDEGNLVVLSTVVDVLKSLSPLDYAEYAPIAGVPGFLETVKTAVFGKDIPTDLNIATIATPGGTGAIRNTIQNYSRRGDVILTSDWYWSPYLTIAQELERGLETYPLFTEDGKYFLKGFSDKMNSILNRQGRIVILINTPAHNPTGYTLSSQDWDGILSAMKDAASDKSKKIVFLVDIAYIDFAEDPEADRSFFKKFNDLPENILPLIGFSMSKSLTMYGMRGGALMCLTPNSQIAEEFKKVVSFSTRGSWSNGTRSAMVAMQRIFEDPALLQKVNEERSKYGNMLLRRGQTFVRAAEEAGLELIPFRAGFFLIVPCDNPDEVSEELQKDGIFAVPFGGRGLRVSVASVPETMCATMPAKIADAIKRVNGKQ